MLPKCTWSHECGNDLIQIEAPAIDRIGRQQGLKQFWVKPEYRQDLEAYCQHTVRFGKLFLIAIVGLSAAMVIATILGPLGAISRASMGPIIGVLLALMGMFIVFCPFTTPETQEWLGIRTASKVGRISGLITIVLGLIIAVLT